MFDDRVVCIVFDGLMIEVDVLGLCIIILLFIFMLFFFVLGVVEVMVIGVCRYK